MSEADRDKWNARWREAPPSAEPSSVLVDLAANLPDARSRSSPLEALDVAGGGGRHALWLARRGWDVTIVDVSSVGLELATERARAAGVGLRTCVADLENEALPRPQRRPGWDLILCVHYLDRRLFPRFIDALAPSGTLIVIHPTRENLQRHARPPAAFLLEPGELPTLVPPELTLVVHEEGWTDEGRCEARVVARKR